MSTTEPGVTTNTPTPAQTPEQAKMALSSTYGKYASSDSLVSPDTTNLTTDVSTVAKSIVPILSTKVRATIYTVGGIVGPGLIATGDVIGGQIGTICQAAGGAVGAATAAFALSHTSD